MNTSKFSILITTKNRLEDLKFTLNLISYLLEKDNVECIVCDDGSNDGTSEYLEENYSNILLLKNKESKGLIFSRNRLLSKTTSDYAITLDDDAHIVSNNPLEVIEHFFSNNSSCAVIACRIFWGKELPNKLAHELENTKVKGFVGCGHVWRMDAWRDIPNYPDWFIFYGEEAFASYHLFKKRWEVWYVPNILVQHRVNVRSRKTNKDYGLRLRRSLRSGWYLYFMFYPIKNIPRKLAYTLWIQFKTKVFKGDFKALLAIFGAIINVIFNLPKLLSQRTAFSIYELDQYNKLHDTIIYWNPKLKSK
ncbi:glycosyltransferase family 2 protein [Olleya sp. 1-3]|uniref:glycosyltransferase family 2 protein n=1 Tax=Olleya sp. 1-3 TaxID=2058323 RepID=UPI000C32BD68|nr:glycosyltransferase family 2 protein [Olleya sp. 1-3]PKG51711.1 glycosyl transferase [Olleya sp. 1-3]